MKKLKLISNRKSESVAVARKVIEREIEGLQALENALGAEFEKAIQLLLNIKGRVVVSGMGKSGHIARKIAATMASTGTPAIFVHPSEASHGDLGMVTQDDALILLSNSGETAELSDLIHYSRRFSIPLIAMVRRKSSMLVKAADIAFVLPEIPEASPVNAPTTSTTMMLVLGDALAMALVDCRGFTKDDFQRYHPGGKLGKQLMQVKDLMHKGADLPLISPDALMSDALIEMTKKRLGCVAVVNKQNELLGILTDGDLRRHMGKDLLSQPVRKLMTKNPQAIAPNALAVTALNQINARNITCLCVVEEKREKKILTGIIHIHDLLREGVM